MKIQIREDLIQRSGKNQSELADQADLTFPTINKLAHSRWSPKSFSVLGKYLEAVGYTVEKLKETKFSEIFKVW
jgi:transcriptional regulator with XRE-family HTH domain